MDNQTSDLKNKPKTITHNPEFKHLETKPVAFFCAEYGIDEKLPIYAGGLGILAGDFILEASQQGLPLVAVGLFYRHGFATYQLKNQGDKTLDPTEAGFFLQKDENGNTLIINVEIDGRTVNAQVWVKSYGCAQLFLLDTDVEGNNEEDKNITDYLYPGSLEKKILQEMILGFGGVKLLQTLGIEPHIYHLNEGHTAFVILALAFEYLERHPEETSMSLAIEAIKKDIVATKHTILPSAGLFFEIDKFHDLVRTYVERSKVDLDEFIKLGIDENNPNYFSTTRLLMYSAERANAVSMLHAIFEKREHPHSKLIPITNGVHKKRWQAQELLTGGLAKLSDSELWQIRNKLRKDMIDFVASQTGVNLDPNAMTVVWAKRFAEYKQPLALFHDLGRLKSIINKDGQPVNVIVSGNASAADQRGQELINQMIEMFKDENLKERIVYVPQYSITSAKHLVQGADLWLNTPERGKEASGTSGMKAGLNGALQFSTSDGWIEEVDLFDIGWILPEGNLNQEIYNILENIQATFYHRNQSGMPENWVQRMRKTMSMVSEQYTTRRMMQEYLNLLYFPSTEFSFELSENNK